MDQTQTKINPLSLKVNFSWTFIGNVVYAASQWGMLALIAKIGSVHMVGQFSLALALTAPVYMFTNLQLRGVIATDAYDEYSFNDYIGLRLIMILVAIGVIITIISFGRYEEGTTLVVLLVALSKGVESISDICMGLIQKHERMDRIAISYILKGMLSITTFGGLLFLTHQIVIALVGLNISWLILLMLYDLPNARRYSSLRPRFQTNSLWSLVRLSLPLGVVMMIISINVNIPRYFIMNQLGEESLGYFAAISYIIVAGSTVVNALGQSAAPRLSKYYASGNKLKFKSLLYKLGGIGVVLGFSGFIASTLFGRQILTLLYKKEYAEYSPIFILTMISAGLGYLVSFMGYGLTAARCFKIQPWINLVAVLVNVIGCLILIPHFGLIGAAYASIINSLVLVFGSMAVLIYLLDLVGGHNNEC